MPFDNICPVFVVGSCIIHHCGSLKFAAEGSGLCCGEVVEVKLPLLAVPPLPLHSLLCEETSESGYFQSNTQRYNRSFHFILCGNYRWKIWLSGSDWFEFSWFPYGSFSWLPGYFTSLDWRMGPINLIGVKFVFLLFCKITNMRLNSKILRIWVFAGNFSLIL